MKKPKSPKSPNKPSSPFIEEVRALRDKIKGADISKSVKYKTSTPDKSLDTSKKLSEKPAVRMPSPREARQMIAESQKKFERKI